MVNGMMKVMTKVNVMHGCFLAALGLVIAFGSPQAIAAARRGDRSDCHSRAIAELRRLSAHGYAIYKRWETRSSF